MYFFFLGPVSSFLRGTLRRTEGLSYSAYRSLYHYEIMRFYQLGAQRGKGLKLFELLWFAFLCFAFLTQPCHKVNTDKGETRVAGGLTGLSHCLFVSVTLS